jgi:hypothetical protein
MNDIDYKDLTPTPPELPPRPASNNERLHQHGRSKTVKAANAEHLCPLGHLPAFSDFEGGLAGMRC